MHEGTGKIWYVLPSSERLNFEKFVRKNRRSIYKNDPDLLKSLNLQINPNELTKNGIKVYRTVQRPGEFILTFPGSYHAGVSVGYNMAEAINFTWVSWLKYCAKAIEAIKSENSKIPIFPMEWMLVENIRNFKDIDLSYSARLQLLKYFDKFLEDEQEARKIMFGLFSKNELSDYLFNFKNRDSISEDKFECSQWSNLWYISIIKCNKWSILYWLIHGICCGWTKKDIKIVVRYSDEELIDMRAKAEMFIKTLNTSAK